MNDRPTAPGPAHREGASDIPATTSEEPTSYTPLDEVVELFDCLTPVQREAVREIVRAMADHEGTQ